MSVLDIGAYYIYDFINKVGWEYLEPAMIIKIKNKKMYDAAETGAKFKSYIDDCKKNYKRGSEEYKKYEERAAKIAYWVYEIRFRYDCMLCGEKEGDENYHLILRKRKGLKSIFARACRKKSGDVLARLGYFYYIGEFVTKKPDKEKATYYFEEARRKKSFLLECLIGDALIYKSNNLEDYRKAIPFYEAALKKKVLFARTGLARCYLKLGINLEEAKELFIKDQPAGVKKYIEEVDEAMKKRQSR